jgi:hypothetical protein
MGVLNTQRFKYVHANFFQRTFSENFSKKIENFFRKLFKALKPEQVSKINQDVVRVLW